MSNIESITSPTVEKHDRWLLHVEQWKNSNLSQRAFCQQAGIKYSTFVYWKGMLRSRSSEKTKKNFSPVKVVSASSLNMEAPKAIQVKLLTGHVVYIPTTMDTKEIATLIHLLGNINA